MIKIKQLEQEFKNQDLDKKKQQPCIKIKKISPDAIIPTKMSKKAAGYDLYSPIDKTIPPGTSVLIFLGFQLELPDDCYGRIADRSSLALKDSVFVGGGVVDVDYRGNVGVILYNNSTVNYQVRKGSRIAQLVCEKIFYPELKEIHGDDVLGTTDRGEGGFGSSGK